MIGRFYIENPDNRLCSRIKQEVLIVGEEDLDLIGAGYFFFTSSSGEDWEGLPFPDWVVFCFLSLFQSEPTSLRVLNLSRLGK